MACTFLLLSVGTTNRLLTSLRSLGYVKTTLHPFMAEALSQCCARSSSFHTCTVLSASPMRIPKRNHRRGILGVDARNRDCGCGRALVLDDPCVCVWFTGCAAGIESPTSCSHHLGGYAAILSQTYPCCFMSQGKPPYK